MHENTESSFTGRVPGRDATAVTAIGLRVGNAYEAFKRADKLGYEIVEPEEVGAGVEMHNKGRKGGLCFFQ